MLGLVLLIIILFNKLPVIENFENNLDEQTSKHITKNNDNLYDKFYVDIYDKLVHSDVKNKYEISNLQKIAYLDDNSIVLDVGSGTGRHCSIMEKLGCSCTGIDTSSSMIEKSKKIAPKSKFIKENVLTTMIFPANSFTHITVFYFTLYYLKNKKLFFKNAYHWLTPGGYLIIHLVNKHKFDPIIPAGDPLLLLSAQKYSKERITNTTVKFDQFKYKSNFTLKDDDKTAVFDEKFTFPSGKVRRNNHVLWMDDQTTILGMAKNIGFILTAKLDLTRCLYDKQYLYVLQKPN
jgi:ubiquinone/menaquinone biosynthesis C-methylase UbiE|tara:strand:- start:8163 stop:9035 length:873 start_codon:yes stop_codon:yes gene_type:complete